MKPTPLIVFSGLTWIAMGTFLVYQGLCFLVHPEGNLLFLPSLVPLTGGQEKAALFLISIALFAGYIKGRVVLKKSVNRIVSRLRSFSGPISFLQVYPPGYLLLIVGMIALGVCLRWVPQDLRGTLDVAVGSALINGALLYFRSV